MERNRSSRVLSKYRIWVRSCPGNCTLTASTGPTLVRPVTFSTPSTVVEDAVDVRRVYDHERAARRSSVAALEYGRGHLVALDAVLQQKRSATPFLPQLLGGSQQGHIQVKRHRIRLQGLQGHLFGAGVEAAVGGGVNVGVVIAGIIVRGA